MYSGNAIYGLCIVRKHCTSQFLLDFLAHGITLWFLHLQIKQLNEPIEVKIFEWNTGGLLTRIEVSLVCLLLPQ